MFGNSRYDTSPWGCEAHVSIDEARRLEPGSSESRHALGVVEDLTPGGGLALASDVRPELAAEFSPANHQPNPQGANPSAQCVSALRLSETAEQSAASWAPTQVTARRQTAQFPATPYRFKLRPISSFFIWYWSVVRLSPSLDAAPCLPPTTPLVSRRILLMCSRSMSCNVCAATVVSGAGA